MQLNNKNKNIYIKNKQIWHSTNFFFKYSINMYNLQQKEIQNEVEQMKREINLLQDKLEQSEKKTNFIAKCTKANRKNANQSIKANRKKTKCIKSNRENV